MTDLSRLQEGEREEKGGYELQVRLHAVAAVLVQDAIIGIRFSTSCSKS
jgi:hypothetical protein